MGPSYVPRTEHLDASGKPKYTNRLILESSPYLLQHAHNPINWYPWGDEAFERARQEGKLVLMSVGYSTCHWCHVMERESFEDLEIAAFINQNFIAIKVDREERPDVDSIYMTAVNILSGRGGWPMTTVLTPDREPVFAGTYFPPRDGVRGRRGLLSILKELLEKKRENPQTLVDEARALSVKVQRSMESHRPAKIPGPQHLRQQAQALVDRFDSEWGGFGRAPKFPQASTLAFLGRYVHRTGDPLARNMWLTTLRKMAAGGMYDQVGGGFHRYSVDRRWLVPHFEKMLYDNAQLAVNYLEAFALVGGEEFLEVATGILTYVAREMTHPRGGFYSATDADSPGPDGHDEEGLFFTWTLEEMTAVLGAKKASRLGDYWGVQAGGNFEGRTILHGAKSASTVAALHSIPTEIFSSEIEEAKSLLYRSRKNRKPPIRDDKILAAWNGLMISAFARVGFFENNAAHLKQARRAGEFIWQSMWVKGELKRNWLDGRTPYRAYLDDYAMMIQAFLDLYEATGEILWYERAKTLQEKQDISFLDLNDGGYFFTDQASKSLMAREKPSHDGALPSGNSVAVLNALRFEQYTADPIFRELAERTLTALGGQLTRSGPGNLLVALDFYLASPLQVVIVKPTGDDGEEMMNVYRKNKPLHSVLAPVSSGRDDARTQGLIPLTKHKTTRKGKTTAYVCQGNVCDLPTTDPALFKKQLETLGTLASKLKSLKPPAPTPAPWFYDASTNRHWHPGHGHWHSGASPQTNKQAFKPK
jgi:uncharacterized protein